MTFVSSLLVYLALLQVVEASTPNISAVVITKSVEVMLIGLDQRLCDYIEPPVLPRIDVVFVFTTPKIVCTPLHTTLANFIESSNKILSYYSHNNIKCSLRKKEGMIEETNSTTTAPPSVVIVLVNNMSLRERNKPNKKDLLYQKVRIAITQSKYNSSKIFCA